MHDYRWDLDAGDRVEVVCGWAGRAWNDKASVWTVLTTVYADRVGFNASPHWWSLRRNVRFGHCDRVRYDDALLRVHAEAAQ